MRIISSPTQLSGCALWLDAADQASLTMNATGSVSQWSDKSGQGNHFTQSDNLRRATYNASGAPSLVFNDSWYQCANSLASIAEGEIFIVAKVDEDPPVSGSGGFWSFGSAGDNCHVPWIDSNVYDDWGSTLRKSTGNPTAPLTQWFAYNVVSRNGEWTSRINRSIHFRTTTNTAGFNSTIQLGKGPGASAYTYLQGQIREVVMFSRALSPAERTLVERYLNNKWSLYTERQSIPWPQRFINSPTELSGCALWLDASVGITLTGSGAGLVQQWSDQSGNGNHATAPNVSNGVPYVAGTSEERASLLFDGSNTWLSGTMSLPQDKTLFVVCKDAGSTDGISSIVVAHQNDGGNTAQGFYYDASNDTVVSDFAGGSSANSATAPVTSRQLVLLANRYSQGGLKSRANGGSTSFRGDDFRRVTTAFHLGFRNDGISTRKFKGHIYEVIWYSRALSDAEILLVERYLNRKH